MSTHKCFDKICCVILIFTILLTAAFINAEKLGVQRASAAMGYESKLFDTAEVHNINIVMDNWDEFISNCESEEYYAATVVIDNEAYKNVAIRGKGNTSLTQVKSYGNNRYSFKIEFDHYDSAGSYHGLDKLCLNNIIQDNTYMKDYLCYTMMRDMGVASPLCSFVYITVNGEDWGLYLAVEGVEDSFLKRNYGNDSGELYKPDSSGMGGGRGNGKAFDAEDSSDNIDPKTENAEEKAPNFGGENGDPPQMPGSKNSFTANLTVPDLPDNNTGDNGGKPAAPGEGDGNGSDDILLKYIDDDADSYPNIFNNAKTDIGESDKTRLIKSLKNLSEGKDLENTVDKDSVIRYFAVHNFVLNFDSYTGSMIHNYYLYEKDGQMQMIPWDYNLAFGGFKSEEGATELVNYPIDSPVSGGDTADRPMIAWIFENEEYTELYHKYLGEFINKYFESGYFEKTTDSVISMISPYVSKDPTKFCTYEEFQKGAETLKEFCLLRAESVSAQLDGTIASTSDDRQNDTDTLINADGISVDDMGSMGGGKDRKNSKGGQDNNSASEPDFDNTADSQGNKTEKTDTDRKTPPSLKTDDENSKNGEPSEQTRSGIKPDFDDRQDESRDFLQKSDDDNKNDKQSGSDAQSRDTDFRTSLIIIVVSAAVLLSGICFALFYRR